MQVPDLLYDAKPIDRLDDPTEAQFEPYLREGTPVILGGQLESWALFRKLRSLRTEDAKLEMLGSLVPTNETRWSVFPERVDGESGSGGRRAVPHANQFDDRGRPRLKRFAHAGPFRQVLELVRAQLWKPSSAAVYMATTQIPELNPHVGGLPFISDCFVESSPRYFWVGGGQRIPLHHDIGHNFLCMLEGSKLAVLYPPELIGKLNRAPLHRTLGHAPQLGFTNPFDESSRLYPDADLIAQTRVARFGPGDILYLPSHWWHAVESAGLNVMTNIWYHDLSWERRTRVHLAELKATVAFADASEGARAQYRSWFRESTAADMATPAGLGQDAHRENMAVLRELWAAVTEPNEKGPITPVWARHCRAFADWVVFRSDGEPFANLRPGIYPKMIQFLRDDPQSPLNGGAVRSREHDGEAFTKADDAPLELSFATADELRARVTSKIEGGGLFIEVPSPPDPGSRVVITLSDAGLRAHGTVAWASSSGEKAAYGIRLDELRGPGAQQLVQLARPHV